MTDKPLTDEEIDKVSRFTYNLLKWIDKKEQDTTVKALREQYEDVLGLLLKNNISPEAVLTYVAPDSASVSAFTECASEIGSKKRAWIDSQDKEMCLLAPTAFEAVLKSFSVRRRTISAESAPLPSLEDVRREVKSEVISRRGLGEEMHEVDYSIHIPTGDDFNAVFTGIVADKIHHAHRDLRLGGNVIVPLRELARAVAREASGSVAKTHGDASAQALEKLDKALIDIGADTAVRLQIRQDIRSIAKEHGANIDGGSRNLN